MRADTQITAEDLVIACSLGSMKPGMRVDLLVLYRNIYSVESMDIAGTNVNLTVFDGCIVYLPEVTVLRYSRYLLCISCVQKLSAFLMIVPGCLAKMSTPLLAAR